MRVSGLLCLHSLASAQPSPAPCALSLRVEGVPDPEALQSSIFSDARAAGACARPWSLRISPGSDHPFVLSLDTGTEPEVRWARTPAEIVAVAALLLRAAVEHDPAPTAQTAPPAPPPPDPDPPWWRIGPFASAGLRHRVGPSLDLGLLAWFGHPWQLGGTLSFGASRGTETGRYDLTPAFLLARLWPLSSRLSLGVHAAIGLESSWGWGVVGGVRLREQSFGGLLGAGPELRWRTSGDHVFFVALPLRFSFHGAGSPQAVTVTTTENPGNSDKAKGKGPKDKEETTSTFTSDLSDRMGGWSSGLTLGFLF